MRITRTYHPEANRDNKQVTDVILDEEIIRLPDVHKGVYLRRSGGSGITVEFTQEDECGNEVVYAIEMEGSEMQAIITEGRINEP